MTVEPKLTAEILAEGERLYTEIQETAKHRHIASLPWADACVYFDDWLKDNGPALLLAAREHEQLKRTVEFQSEQYLAAHGGSWGECKYQAQLEEARATNQSLNRRLQTESAEAVNKAMAGWSAKRNTGRVLAEARAAEAEAERDALAARLAAMHALEEWVVVIDEDAAFYRCMICGCRARGSTSLPHTDKCLLADTQAAADSFRERIRREAFEEAVRLCGALATTREASADKARAAGRALVSECRQSDAETCRDLAARIRALAQDATRDKA